LTVIIVS
jgi:NAD(P)-dependent dehydrogenase (short-subunit alcohol dehydrogenase family)